MRISERALKIGFLRLGCMGLLIALVWWRATDPSSLEELRVQTFDFYQVLHPRQVSQQPALIVDIDEASLRKIGQWPWPRIRLAELIDKLTDEGAAVIAFDMLLSEPDRLSPQFVAKSFTGLDDETRQRLLAAPDNDQMLAAAIKRSHVVLGESGLATPQAQSAAGPAALGIATFGDPKPFLFKFPGLLSSLPVLDAAAGGRGMLSIRTERDGIVRRVPMIMEAQGQIRPALTFEMLRVVDNASTILVRSGEGGVQSVAVPGFEIATDANAQLWVHFSGHDPKRYVSAVDVLEGRVPRDRIADKLVLVGTSAAGLLDVKTTPVDSIMPGVEVHAEILESVLSGDVLSAPSYALGLEILLAVVVGLVIIVMAPMAGPLLLMSFGVVAVAGIVTLSWYFFTQHNLLIDPTFPLLSSVLIYGILVFAKYVTEQAQRRRIRSAFGQYMSPALVEQLAQSPEKLVLGGEQRQMTVMFSDVRGFTTVSELYKDDPQGLTQLMNRLLTPLTNAIIESKGTIDKYIGDAIMAFWNAPLDDSSHEVNACNAALDMQRRLVQLNDEREREAKEAGVPYIPLQVGIGVNTGTCVVGNMGSNLRFDYSVLGDSVNLASRLEGQTRIYGVPIILGEKTALSAKQGGHALIEIDRIAVKGKTQPATAFALLGDSEYAATVEFARLRELISAILEHYRAQDWDSAAAKLDEARRAEGGDRLVGLVDLYAARIATFRKAPPPSDWNGVFVSQTK